jgi:hypothetical protein
MATSRQVPEAKRKALEGRSNLRVRRGKVRCQVSTFDIQAGCYAEKFGLSNVET